jgi:hypothetical protein
MYLFDELNKSNYITQKPDPNWSRNSASLQTCEIRSYIVTKQKDHKSNGYADKFLYCQSFFAGYVFYCKVSNVHFQLLSYWKKILL